MYTLMWLHYQQYLLNFRFQLCALAMAESSKYTSVYVFTSESLTYVSPGIW